MKAVVITGASTGIGKATALRLSQSGFQVFAGVRKEADAEALQREMKVTPILLEVTNNTQINEAVAKVKASMGDAGLYGLVNNAGIAVAGPLEFLPATEFRNQFEVNVFAQLAVTQAFLPLLRQGLENQGLENQGLENQGLENQGLENQGLENIGSGRMGSGRIVMMSSIAGRFASPLLGPYAASKFALEGLSDTLRRELAPWNLHVSLVEPGRIATPIWDKSLQTADAMAKSLPPEAQALYADSINLMRARAAKGNTQGVPADDVAKAVAHALTAARPKIRYVVGPDAKQATLLLRVLPDRLLDWLARQRQD
jgi:NAD(P)-dependent dehydrogenase (short-subunit alcohol dehydrogenase family)